MTAASTSLSRRRPGSERIIETVLALAAAVSVVTTLGIIVVLLVEALEFFREINPIAFLTGTTWSATIEPHQFGVLPLVAGTLMVACIALLVAIPLGLVSAIYLAEYATSRIRNVVKPLLETIAGIPTIVLGFFGLNFVTPYLLKPIFGSNIGTFNVLAGGLMVGLLVTPLIASLSEDALRAVPRGLREGALAMGATRFEMVRKVIVPAALSGIMASIILALSRAIGETMIVMLATGTSPKLTGNPLDSAQTMTAFIAQISGGDTPQGSIQFKSLFAVALVLFVLTLVLNLISNRVVARFRNVY